MTTQEENSVLSLLDIVFLQNHTKALILLDKTGKTEPGYEMKEVVYNSCTLKAICQVSPLPGYVSYIQIIITGRQLCILAPQKLSSHEELWIIQVVKMSLLVFSSSVM